MSAEPRALRRLFAELKRRRVFKSAALYGGAAFVVFQAADFVVPALHLSEGVSTDIVLLSVLLFPVAMTAAWFYDVTSGGIRRTAAPARGELEAIVDQPALKRWPVGIAALLGVLLFLGAVAWHLRAEVEVPFVAGEAPTVGSVAVLPFLNMLGNEEESYLAEGIGDELLQALGRVRGLRVTGRSSTLSFGDGAVDFGLMGRELGVTSFVEGSVGDAGDRVGLAVHLITVGDEEHSWTKSYQLPREGFLVALDEVAWDLAGQLGAEVPRGRRKALVRASTGNFQAFCDYARGRSLSEEGTPEALNSAIGYYNRALLLDPDFGPAWSALATAYVLLPEYGGPPMLEILPYAEAALDRAMEPGKEMAEGFAASGYLKWDYLWDLPGAEEDFRRSIDLDPENPVSRSWYAQFLTTERRWDEGMDQVRQALELDPRSAGAHLTKGLLLLSAGLPGADLSLRQALELAPKMHTAAYILAGSLAREGDLEGAAKEFDRFSSLTGSDPKILRHYLAALADPSKRSEAVEVLRGASFYGSVQGAGLLADLGETDAALTLLEQAAKSHSPYLPWVNALPQFQNLRSDRRFQGVLAWVGF